MSKKGGDSNQGENATGKTYTFAEISKHTAEDDTWIVIRGKVYDVTKFLPDHPGGQEVVRNHAGKDATSAFDDVFHSPKAQAMLKDYEIGSVEGYQGPTTADAPSSLQAQSASSSSGLSPQILTLLVFFVITSLLGAFYQLYVKQ